MNNCICMYALYTLVYAYNAYIHMCVVIINEIKVYLNVKIGELFYMLLACYKKM